MTRPLTFFRLRFLLEPVSDFGSLARLIDSLDYYTPSKLELLRLVCTIIVVCTNTVKLGIFGILRSVVARRRLNGYPMLTVT